MRSLHEGPTRPTPARRRASPRPVLLLAVLGLGLGCTDFGDPILAPPPRVATVVITEPADPRPEIEVGTALQFAAEARDAAGGAIPGAPIVWSTSAPGVASIDATGRAVGLGEGTTDIRAASGTSQSAAVALSVVPATQVPVSVVILSPASPADLFVGEALAFTAEVRDTHGDPILGAVVGWSSTDPAVARIDAGGTATGVAPGTVDVTASIGVLTSAAVVLRVAIRVPDFTTQVQPIFNNNCTVCHGLSGGLDLAAGASYTNLVNVRANGSSLRRVAPGNPDNSFLYIKLAACPGPLCSGTRMPQGGPPLPAAQVQIIRDWIAGGAPP